MTACLLWLAAGIWLCGRRAGPPAAICGPRRLPGRWLRAAALAGTATVAVVVLGPMAGAVTAMCTVPVVNIAVMRLQASDHRRVDVATRRAIPLTLDLLAAVLRTGQPLVATLEAVASTGGALRSDLVQVAGLLRLGADPKTAWHDLAEHPLLGPVARTAARSAESGIRLAQGFEQLATDLRTKQRASAAARAHRAGVWAVAPLGLCFLPAFVCLGIIPVIVGITRDIYPGVVG